MISRLKPEGVDVASLTTIATPHHGSSFADHILDVVGSKSVANARKAPIPVFFQPR